MSANNYLLINRRTFKVFKGCADCENTKTQIGQGKNLEEAIDIADYYTQIHEVEYGINFFPIFFDSFGLK